MAAEQTDIFGQERPEIPNTVTLPGYRQLNSWELLKIKQIKALGDSIESVVAELEDNRATSERRTPSGYKIDQRWVAIAKTHLQQGLMALTRSVAQPESFG